MKKIFLFMMFLINILFLNFNNPLIMGILMMIQSLNLIIIMGKIYYSFWFSYIMFLVFIGGLFILFVYVISMIYNNKFFSLKNYKYIMMIILLFMTIYYFIFYKSYFLLNNEMNLMNMKMFKENYISSLKFYNMPNNFINLMLIFYLFMLMIIVVKITNFFSGPIKVKFYF